VLERALEQLFGEAVKVTGAGRTDSGVHASGQVVSLATAAHFPFDRLLPALRAVLPADLAVRHAQVVANGFSARHDALERTYVYTILNSSERSALLNRYAHHVARPLDAAAMRAAAEHLLGELDFRSFAAVPADQPSVRSLRRLAIEPRGELIRIEAVADGFLHHMVRTIVGTLVECGIGRRDPAQIPSVVAARDRAAAGATAPACGLYLAGVRYPDGYDSFAEPPVLGSRAVRRAPLTEDGPFP